ncbi:MAG TPA: hypothetical protein VMV43_00225 [Candidatus Nanopelagicaceae bacterium]|jgi:hypothetical protein|nr:hypothetical protein [Candidatus Nanopelagicaceae bacterium]
MTEEKTISYPYLLKRALKVSIEVAFVLIILFFLPEIIQLIQLLYGF